MMKRQPTRKSVMISAGSILAIVLGFGLLIGMLWWLTVAVSSGWLRVWAVLATLALPVTAWLSWRIGHIRSDALVEGIDTGIDKVSNAAKRFRQPSPRVQVANIVPPAQLPQPQIIHRQLSGGGEDVVEL